VNSHDGSLRRHSLLRGWRQPVITMVSMALSVGLVAVVSPQPGALVLVGALAMTMSRNRLVLTWRGRVEAVILLPAIALATAAVGLLLEFVPVVGAVAFIAAMFLAIWLRRYGAIWARIGSLIALPFITLLIVPGGGAGTTLWGAAVLSIVALVVVVVVRLAAEMTKFVPRERGSGTRSAADRGARRDKDAKPSPVRTSSLRPIASTRMAIQIAVALSGAFPLGWFMFPGHVTWAVLTAYLVCSGNRGRADVLYKSGLRIVGAVAGTIAAGFVLALTPAGHPLLQGPLLVVVLLSILGVGLWLREWTYAAWALAMTLVITLLQGAVIPVEHASGATQLWERVLAIVVGAACGLAASWFVLPIRSEGVVRRRLADALAALSECLTAPSPEADNQISEALSRLDEVARPWNAWEQVSWWRQTSRKPGQWMRLVHESVRLARVHPDANGPVRRALGEARKSLREPLAIGPALVNLRDALAQQ
jgi:hypothetical protein